MEDLLRDWNIDIVATDICQEVLEKAKAGLYSQFEVQRGLPIQMLVKYFQQTGSLWQIDSSIRSMVKYKYYNLLDDYTALGTFDMIFCRNVLIYFAPETKSEMLARMAKRLRSDGYLVLGAAETVVGISDAFTPVSGARGLYALKPGAASAVAPAAAAMAAPAMAAVAAQVAAAAMAAPVVAPPAAPPAQVVTPPAPAVAPAPAALGVRSALKL